MEDQSWKVKIANVVSPVSGKTTNYNDEDKIAACLITCGTKCRMGCLISQGHSIGETDCKDTCAPEACKAKFEEEYKKEEDGH